MGSEKLHIRTARNYIICAALLMLAPMLLHGSEWRSSAEFHTVLEVLATALSFIVGAIALVHYYSTKSHVLLFIGVGFLGTSALDGYHAIVTSNYFREFMPSGLPALVPWSWTASRIYLSLFMLLSWVAWYLNPIGRPLTAGTERMVYLGAIGFTAVVFAFFALVPLPRAYYPEFLIHRPEELVPGIFFMAALIGYIKKGHWRTDPVEYWLVLALIVSVIAQFAFMPFSSELFDPEFDAAHVLKKATYCITLFGLLHSMYGIFKSEARAKQELAGINQRLEELVDERTKSLAESESRFRDIAECASDWIWEADTAGRFTYVSDQVLEKTGYSAAELTGAKKTTLMHAEDTQATMDAWDALSRSGEPVRDLEVTFNHRNGQPIICEINAVPVMAENGTLQGYRGVYRDVTTSRQLYHELEAAKEKAEAANIAKSQFLATMSHEIRTPLTGILGMTDLLLQADVEDEHRSNLETIRACGSHLLQILSDILDLSKIEAGMMVLHEGPLDLAALLSEVKATFEPVGLNKGLELQTRIKGDTATTPTLSGDVARLRQVLFNLVGNALKFTERGQVRVTIDVQPTETEGAFSVGIEVADTGIGIPAEKREAIFNAFEQVENDVARTYEGTGLGLAICRKLVNQMGGTLTVDSSPGTGSVFTVALSCMAFVERRAEDRSTSLPTSGDIDRTLTILLAEDNEVNARLIQAFLNRAGHTVILAPDGHEAIEMARKQLFDCILMDINMPYVNGRDAFQVIRQSGANRETPVIALTAGMFDDEVAELRSIGFDEVLGKPIDWQRLITTLQAV